MAELSPMMKQYFEIKEKNKDSILFFRLGDFYEMFFDDAKLASRELDLTLTGRDCGQKERAPMCGVPFHSCESYIARLVQKGYKVAICEQTEDPAKAKGLVKRDIIRVITPGTVIESGMLDEGKNNFISSAFMANKKIGLSFCDISTGELFITEISGEDLQDQLQDQLISYNPREILIGGEIVNFKTLPNFIKEKLSASVEMLTDDEFGYSICLDAMKNQFKENDVNSIKDKKEMVSSVGALLSYLKVTQITGYERINTFEVYNENQYMNLDYNTRRNLELTRTMMNKEKKGSLIWLLDKTKTAMGKRLLRYWLEHPLLNIGTILNRQSAIADLVDDTVQRLEITESLIGIFDIERLMTKIVYGNANARELRSLCGAFENLPQIKNLISKFDSSLMRKLTEDIDPLEDIHQLIDTAIEEEPPFSVREGGLIKEGYNEELDAVRSDMNNSTSLLAQIELEQKEKTGIPKLKVGYNRVFGYYIEVTNSYKDKVPEEYIRKQTLTNCERYITQELKDLEGRILGAKDRSFGMEYAIFDEIRKVVANNLDRIEKTAKAIATLDVLTSLANVASDNNYTRPEVNQSSKIILKDSRHPVVEALLSGAPFVPNDVTLDNDSNRVAIITGPNMAGKSTYMRQVALIVLMAQMGSFVPASYAEIGVVDSIFTRVGASDDLASGQSTFMVEMNEVANIVKKATKNSLLILDEIGRGTSTYDGMSIARAVLEFVADKKKLGAKALFATHYHELTVMENLLDGVKNYNIAVKKRGDDITFLRRIIPGGADDSYGIEVAKLAGLPDWIIKRAKEILKELTSGKTDDKETFANISPHSSEDDMQLNLLDTASNAVTDKLKSVDVNTLTPIEAMNLLYELNNMI
ncbi:DNA mismatch repair protein MutS [Ruminococcus bovis]|uniref:DNA mismatch repair protein MutS n=1 Tax=Ruminococcus bovis TaxID=2564099 RepID=A0A4P8Y007_9FIRM|nr:DNA mismatch repair protein MutS [Ruminococcus bovis]QCT07839.1 DNA mismatch repair protein MutS [Ruminococcus bovis]